MSWERLQGALKCGERSASFRKISDSTSGLRQPSSSSFTGARRLVRDIIRAQRERGATVFLNSHILSEIEITCDEVVFIRDGEVVTSRDLRTQNGEEVRVVVRARKLTPETVAGLAQWSTSTVVNEEQLTLTTRSQDVLPDILRHLVAAGADVFQFTPQRLSLEDLFLKIMGEDRGL